MNSSGTAFVVATIRQWNLKVFEDRIRHFPGEWHLISNREDLTVKRLSELRAKIVFFPHWSWKVPPDITSQFDCIAFHPTDLPYGRGGSPIQNLIVRGHRKTKLTAFRMSAGFDDGPIYMKRPLSLEGSAEEIFLRSAYLTADMIKALSKELPVPTPQVGDTVAFSRRTPEQSALPAASTMQSLFDHIRMLDAEEYPQAFLDFGPFRIEFSNAVQRTDRIEAHVTISEKKADD